MEIQTSTMSIKAEQGLENSQVIVFQERYGVSHSELLEENQKMPGTTKS